LNIIFDARSCPRRRDKRAACLKLAPACRTDRPYRFYAIASIHSQIVPCIGEVFPVLTASDGQFLATILRRGINVCFAT
jgi:hypothetical protein